MIRLRLAELLKQRNWTPYRLAQETGLTVPTAYRLADPKGQFGRINFDTLDRLCAALGRTARRTLGVVGGHASNTKTGCETATFQPVGDSPEREAWPNAGASWSVPGVSIVALHTEVTRVYIHEDVTKGPWARGSVP
jgi:DNA-binding Xre family transcriptional regulator